MIHGPRYLGVLFLFLLTGCPSVVKPDRDGDGVIHDLAGGYARITIRGNYVYRFPGSVVEFIDIADPDAPMLFGRAEVGLACFVYCSGVYAAPDTTYVAALGMLARTDPEWMSPSDFIGEAGLDAISPTLLVAGGYYDPTESSIRIVDISGADPEVVADVSEPVAAQAVSGSRYFATNSSNGMAVYDLQDPFAPVLATRLVLSPADGWNVAWAAPFLSTSIAVSGTSNLFALSWDVSTGGGPWLPCRLNWFELDISGGTASLRSDTSNESRAGCTSVKVVGDFVLVGSAYDSEDLETERGRVAAYRADPGRGLSLVGSLSLPAPDVPTDIAVDPDRGLIAVSAPGALYVFQLAELIPEASSNDE